MNEVRLNFVLATGLGVFVLSTFTVFLKEVNTIQVNDWHIVGKDKLYIVYSPISYYHSGHK